MIASFRLRHFFLGIIIHMQLHRASNSVEQTHNRLSRSGQQVLICYSGSSIFLYTMLDVTLRMPLLRTKWKLEVFPLNKKTSFKFEANWFKILLPIRSLVKHVPVMLCASSKVLLQLILCTCYNVLSASWWNIPGKTKWFNKVLADWIVLLPTCVDARTPNWNMEVAKFCANWYSVQKACSV